MLACQAAVLGALAPISAQASWFEFCDLAGEIRAVSQDVPGPLYRLTVNVSAAALAKDQGEHSYIDCTEYLDTDLEVLLLFPVPVTIPRRGDHVAFERVVAEVIDIEGDDGGLKAFSTLQTHHPAAYAELPARESNQVELKTP